MVLEGPATLAVHSTPFSAITNDKLVRVKGGESYSGSCRVTQHYLFVVQSCIGGLAYFRSIKSNVPEWAEKGCK